MSKRLTDRPADEGDIPTKQVQVWETFAGNCTKNDVYLFSAKEDLLTAPTAKFVLASLVNLSQIGGSFGGKINSTFSFSRIVKNVSVPLANAERKESKKAKDIIFIVEIILFDDVLKSLFIMKASIFSKKIIAHRLKKTSRDIWDFFLRFNSDLTEKTNDLLPMATV